MSMKVIVRDLDAMRTEETSGGVPKKLIRDDDPEFLLPQPTTAIEERVPPSIIGEESIIILDRNAQLGPSASEKDSGHSSQPSPQSALMTLKSMEFDENGELLANRPPAVDCSCGYPQECGHMIQLWQLAARSVPRICCSSFRDRSVIWVRLSQVSLWKSKRSP